MESHKFVKDGQIEEAIENAFYDGVERTADEGRLMLFELLMKSNAGYRNSHTEEAFMRRFQMLKLDRTLNKKGREFCLAMSYSGSNKQPECFNLMEWYRN